MLIHLNLLIHIYMSCPLLPFYCPNSPKIHLQVMNVKNILLFLIEKIDLCDVHYKFDGLRKVYVDDDDKMDFGYRIQDVKYKDV